MVARSWGALLLFLALTWTGIEVAGQDEKFSGYATAYTWPGEKNSQFAGGFNACQFGRLSPYFETYFAALNVKQFDMSLCGRCAAVRGTGPRATGKIVVVKIVDACATCAFGDLDFTTRGSNDITGYSYDHQPIEWWWTSCDNPVPPRWPYFDVAGGMQIVAEARSRGYNVNLAMMEADLTLTGGVIPYPAVAAQVAQGSAAQAIAQAQAARAAANAAANRARQLQTAAAAAWAKVARLQAAANAINGTAQPQAKKAAIDAANAAQTSPEPASPAAAAPASPPGAKSPQSTAQPALTAEPTPSAAQPAAAAQPPTLPSAPAVAADDARGPAAPAASQARAGGSLDLQPRGLVLAPPQGVQGQVAAASLPGTQQALPDGVPVAPGQPQAQQQGQDGAGQQ
ncbi:hypothetical protein ABPG77_001303 [Micractinium sp. CCAP 211/92]